MPDPTNQNDIKLTISGSLPGEQLAITFMNLQMKFYDGATPEVREKISQIIQEDLSRWHALWSRLFDFAHFPKA